MPRKEEGKRRQHAERNYNIKLSAAQLERNQKRNGFKTVSKPFRFRFRFVVRRVQHTRLVELAVCLMPVFRPSM